MLRGASGPALLALNDLQSGYQSHAQEVQVSKLPFPLMTDKTRSLGIVSGFPQGSFSFLAEIQTPTATALLAKHAMSTLQHEPVKHLLKSD